MKGTSIFQFKSWPKIHQPLPRTPRESQQLLNALTSSFRRQLDSAYPSSNATSNKYDERQSVNLQSSVHATDKHLHSILDNPLFRIVPPKDGSHHHNTPWSAERQKLLAEKPMEVLDQLVASGSATVSTITECLKAQLVLARSSDDERMTLAMRDSKAASRVIDWFWASDGTSRRMLLQSRPTTVPLTKFMVAESLHDDVLNLLNMLMIGDLGGQDGLMIEGLAQQTFSNLLVDFINAEIRYGQGMDSALTYYVRTCRMCFATGGLRPEAIGPSKSMLLAAGAQLSRVSLNQKSLGDQVSSNNYDSFMETISTLTSTRSLLYAAVAIAHPTHPDTRPFIRYAEALTPTKFRNYPTTKRDAILAIGCGALRKLMIDLRNDRQANYLAYQIQRLLPETPTSDTRNVSSKRVTSEEDTSLSRLDLNLT